MTTEQILSQIEAINAEVHIYRWKYTTYAKNRWNAKIIWDEEGTKLEVQKTGEHFSEALTQAWLAFDRIANKGLPLARLAAPIEHQPVMPPSRFDFEDEVPS